MEADDSAIHVPTQALVPDPFVERLVPREWLLPRPLPATPLVALAGLLGKSVREGYWRLYFSSGLERYVEFKEEHVHYSVKIPREQPPFAGLQATRVWIRHDAEVEYTRTALQRRMQAKDLRGGLAGRTPIFDDPIILPPHFIVRAVR